MALPARSSLRYLLKGSCDNWLPSTLFRAGIVFTFRIETPSLR